MRNVARWSVLLLCLTVMACGGGGPSPSAPSAGPSGSLPPPTGGGAISGGAIIQGVLTTENAAGFAAAGPSSNVVGVTVQVVGTSVTAAVEPSGAFALQGVPSGTQQLRFSGPSLDASVAISDVQQGETITVAVSAAGGAASIESQSRSNGSDQELEGRVESLPPTQLPGMFVVASRAVTTDGATLFRDGGAARSFSDLQIGMRVHVKGRADGASLLASIVELQNSNTAIPVEINGNVKNLGGNASTFQFTVNDRLIKGDTATVFFGDGSRATTFADLKNDVRVEVKGQQRDAFVYAERIHVNIPAADDDDDVPEQDQSASIDGTLNSIGGSKPMLTLLVGGTTVKTADSTEVRRRGDVQTLDALKVNQRLHVVGTRNADASLTARKIEIEDEPEGNEFEIEGAMGGLKGTCPSVTFGVNGYSIATDASTEFKDAGCTALKNGAKVQVKGTRQANGSVLATRVTKKS